MAWAHGGINEKHLVSFIAVWAIPSEPIPKPPPKQILYNNRNKGHDHVRNESDPETGNMKYGYKSHRDDCEGDSHVHSPPPFPIQDTSQVDRDGFYIRITHTLLRLHSLSLVLSLEYIAQFYSIIVIFSIVLLMPRRAFQDPGGDERHHVGGEV